MSSQAAIWAGRDELFRKPSGRKQYAIERSCKLEPGQLRSYLIPVGMPLSAALHTVWRYPCLEPPRTSLR
eukprot:1279215-Pyramimonas_sp.AAC.1